MRIAIGKTNKKKKSSRAVPLTLGIQASATQGVLLAKHTRVTVCKNYALLVTKKHSLVSRLLVTDLDFEAARAAVLNIPFRVGGPWIVTPGLPLCRCPLTTLGHPPPTAVAESQWGEPRSRAFGTGARVAESISSGPVLLPLVGNRVGRRRGRWGRTGVASLSFVKSWPWSDARYIHTLCCRRVISTYSPRLRAGDSWSVAPYLFLRRRPLTTLGCPPPTAVAESQGGEPHSDTFGTGARVAGLISLWSVLLPFVGNRWYSPSGTGQSLLGIRCRIEEEEGGAVREWTVRRVRKQGRTGLVSTFDSKINCTQWHLDLDIVLGKFGLRPTQTGFEPNPNHFKWFGFGESWLKPNGLVSGLGVPNLVQTKPNRLRKHIKK
ncbi:hypothetical protein EDB85DRAFT_1900650 [Lactarius pseudohatsudake]|nr:hypothetical protein EDB85DRAFT_1900650 [Lactarius pseudohatsudake]